MHTKEAIAELIPIDRDVIYLFKQNKAAVFSLCIIVVFVFVAVFAPILTTHDPLTQDLANRLRPPSSSHLLGTDNFGRDLLSRLLYGARISLWVGLTSVSLSLSIGLALGLVAGYWSGIIGSIIMRATDIMLSFPSILLAIVLMAVLGGGLQNAIYAVSLVFIPRFIRIVRGSTIKVKENVYIEAARMIGASHVRIISRHILPNIMAPIIVYTTLQIGIAILDVAGLGFLGLGAQPPNPEWGAILNDGRDYMITAPHIALFPGLALLVVVMAFNMVGDGLRDAFDPSLRH